MLLQASAKRKATAQAKPFVKREILPGPAAGEDLDNPIRDGAMSMRHPIGPAGMGQDDMAVVDAKLKVKGIAAEFVTISLIRRPNGIALSAEIIRGSKAQLTLCATVSCSFRQSSPAKSAMSTKPILVLRHKWS
jgi:hypothetical protein